MIFLALVFQSMFRIALKNLKIEKKLQFRNYHILIASK